MNNNTKAKFKRLTKKDRRNMAADGWPTGEAITMSSLSIAIREGAKLRHQGFGQRLDENGGTCAIGAALEYCGVSPERLNSEPHWELLRKLELVDSVVDEYNPIAGMVINWNDELRYSREQIADLIEKGSL